MVHPLEDCDAEPMARRDVAMTDAVDRALDVCGGRVKTFYQDQKRP